MVEHLTYNKCSTTPSGLTPEGPGLTLNHDLWVTEAFEGHSGVSFGDVDMSRNPVRPGGEITPGAGGWPTIACFNK